jgi:hypothetical protein
MLPAWSSGWSSGPPSSGGNEPRPRSGEETLRGTPCRTVILSKVVRELRPVRSPALSEEEDDPAEFTVWIDERHVRQIQTDAFAFAFSGDNRKVGTNTLELRDFGVPVDSLDWTRFPGWSLLPVGYRARPPRD